MQQEKNKKQKPVIITMPFADFCKYNKLDYKEDGYDLIFSDYKHYDAATLFDALPDDFIATIQGKQFDKQALQAAAIIDDNIIDNLNRAYNMADEAALADAAYTAQKQALRHAGDYVADLINNTIAGQDANVRICINFIHDTVNITAASYKHLAAIACDVINGEGIFCFDTLREFLESGPYNDKQAATSHLHYIVNGPLIANIYGSSKPAINYDVNYWQADHAYYAELAADELTNYDPQAAADKLIDKAQAIKSTLC